MCALDLEKAFPSIEFSVLLIRLDEDCWYETCLPCKAHALSPLLFSSVVDSLLRKMQESEIGLFINWLPADLLHITDDIRAITNSWDNLNALII